MDFGSGGVYNMEDFLYRLRLVLVEFDSISFDGRQIPTAGAG